MDIVSIITEELNVKKWQVEAAIKLIDEGNTIPFIARYRKEATGTLDDEQLRNLDERLTYLRNLSDRKEAVLSSIKEQGKLTPELEKAIEEAKTLVTLEDIYRPYKQKRRTRATVAKEKGLEDLARFIITGAAIACSKGKKFTKEMLEEKAAEFVKCDNEDDAKNVNTVQEAIEGAQDIIAEQVSDNADFRTHIRKLTYDKGVIETAAKDEKAESNYEMYYSFSEPVIKLAGHRILAINRGENEKILSVKLLAPTDDILHYLTVAAAKLCAKGLSEIKEGQLLDIEILCSKSADAEENTASEGISESALTALTNKLNGGANNNRGGKPLNSNRLRIDPEAVPEVFILTVKDSYERLIAPSIEREIRSALTEKAEDSAINVFGKNLTQLLLAPPISGKTVLGWDPAFRTGCKLAVVDATGKVLDTKVIFPTAPQNKIAEAKEELKKLVNKYKVDIISVGNGTASRESEAVIVDFIKETGGKLQYVIVNEAGASVYSASKLATEEFPNFDVGQRSAASIARRLQDPLAELVKIDPKSIGVGQYQHDCDQKKLAQALGGVVEASVNKVGVDLNTASVPLLSYVSGISKTVASNIVSYREKNGRFVNRKQLLKVEKLGPKAFEQCAGFLRITGGDNPLDSTGVHPESYEAAGKLLKVLGINQDSENPLKDTSAIKQLYKNIPDKKKLSEELGVGEITLEDIVNELEKPGRDPREDSPKPILRSDVLEMKDLKPGMILKGTIRNVIDFGAFVDIGVHQDGLVHISQICDRYIKHPLEAVSVGDIVEVRVLEVDEKKKRISLSMKL